MSFRAIFLSASLLLSAGCANVMPHQAGQTIGAILGGAIAPGIGVPMGSVLGTMAGLIVKREMDRVDEKRERVDLGGSVKPGDAPGALASAASLAPGLPARVWVDETVHDGRMIAGHYDVRPLL